MSPTARSYQSPHIISNIFEKFVSHLNTYKNKFLRKKKVMFRFKINIIDTKASNLHHTYTHTNTHTHTYTPTIHRNEIFIFSPNKSSHKHHSKILTFSVSPPLVSTIALSILLAIFPWSWCYFFFVRSFFFFGSAVA